jgi:hypothetical protein
MIKETKKKEEHKKNETRKEEEKRETWRTLRAKSIQEKLPIQDQEAHIISLKFTKAETPNRNLSLLSKPLNQSHRNFEQ